MDHDDLSSSNPLFSMPPKKEKVVEPLHPKEVKASQSEASPAVDLIRQKISAIYTTEPSAKEEIVEAKAAGRHRSKHQQYMYELSTSGKSLADIQTAWHEYYANLSDSEKHEVWQEFYEQHAGSNPQQDHQPKSENKPQPAKHPTTTSENKENLKSVSELKNQLLKKVQSRSVTAQPSHIKSLIFGISTGLVVVVILLFSFFNERFIAPFITPSRTVSSAPIILDPSSVATGPEPKLIIPKINVEIPVVYDEPSVEEHAVQKALERGVLHYATTPNPGEIGNGVIFGHSSNNILNKGKYKFAFVLLKRLENGDTFIIQKDSKRYVYRVFDKKIVPPSDVSVLNNSAKPATFTLITCDPPGTSINRLVVTAEQISPDPAGNIASKVNQNVAAKPVALPSDAPTLWSRIVKWLQS